MMGFFENDCVSDHDHKRGIWESVAFVYDKAARTQTIVVNGAVVKTCRGSAPFQGTGTVYLGRWFHGEWKGQMSNVKMFNRALTTNQIDAMQRNEQFDSCYDVCLMAHIRCRR